MATESLIVAVLTDSMPVELDSSEAEKYTFFRFEIGYDSVPIINVVPMNVSFSDAISTEDLAPSVVSKVR